MIQNESGQIVFFHNYIKEKMIYDDQDWNRSAETPILYRTSTRQETSTGSLRSYDEIIQPLYHEDNWIGVARFGFLSEESN